MRVAVYTDYVYHRVGDEVHGERAFALFIAALARRVDRLTVVGRLHPGGGPARYPLGDVELVALPYYSSLADPLRAARAMLGSIGAFWRTLGRVDVVWLLGPHPLAFAFAALAALRRRRVVLGVRQESVEYVRNRHPGKRLFAAAAIAMESAFRLLARLTPVVVVGPKLARTYSRSRAELEIAVSLVPESEIAPAVPERRAHLGDELTVLSVGRLDAEKNPVALADVLAALNRAGGRRWRLVVCGEGALAGAVAERATELGVGELLDLRGYVPLHDGLDRLYRESDLLLHVSWTEGLPQVLFEAFAAALPVVATDVGGIREATEGAALLVAPGDPDAGVAALERLAGDDARRKSQIERGLELVRARSLEAETASVARFLAGGGGA